MYWAKLKRSLLLIGVLPFGLAACSSGGGDPVRGAELYAKECAACHSLSASTDNAPMHCGLIGRKAGSVPGFDYSKAMRQSGIVWDDATLDRFLENPRAVVPGTKMTYAGVKDAQERADLIAYLKQATKPPAP